MKFLIAVFSFTVSLSALATPLAQVVERNSHDIMKLVKTAALPAVATEKLHMVRVTETADGFNLVAVLDHAGNHDVEPAHIDFVYDKALKIVSFKFVDGFVNPEASPFSKATTARLFDHGAEAFLDSEVPELVAYAEKAMMFHLDYNAEKNIAVFEIISTEGKRATATLTMEGDVVDAHVE